MKFQSANPNELSDKDGNRLCRGSFAGGVQLIIHFSVFPNEKLTGKLCAQRQEMRRPYKNLEIRVSEPLLYRIIDNLVWPIYRICIKLPHYVARMSKLCNALLARLWLFDQELLNHIRFGRPPN